MRRGLATLCLIAGVVGSMAPRLASAAEGEKALTARDNGREIPVKPGDTIHFQLPANSRSGWTWHKLGDDKLFGKPRDVYNAVPNSIYSTLDARYVVQSPVAKTTKVRWIYCRFGRAVDQTTGDPLSPQKPIRPDQNPEQGMIFELTLRPASPG